MQIVSDNFGWVLFPFPALQLSPETNLDYHKVGSAMGLFSSSGVTIAPHATADLHSIFISLTLNPLPGLLARLGGQKQPS